MKIKIITDHGEALAEINETETSKRIFESLPIVGGANVWGEEIYFSLPLGMGLEKTFAKQEMEVGDLAYWPAGDAFCIFFGRTPASINEKPRAISEVTFLGRVFDPEAIDLFKKVEDSEEIVLEKA